jgi:hypothetical protein
MKADDIRTLNERAQEQLLNTQTINEYDGGFKSLLLSLLAEMAAQGAESNENLRRVLNPPLMYDTSNIDPSDWPDLPQPITFIPSEPRATLRDQFAMAALSGYIACDPSGTTYWQTGPQMVDAATNAYVWANVMMEARK